MGVKYWKRAINSNVIQLCEEMQYGPDIILKQYRPQKRKKKTTITRNNNTIDKRKATNYHDQHLQRIQQNLNNIGINWNGKQAY